MSEHDIYNTLKGLLPDDRLEHYFDSFQDNIKPKLETNTSGLTFIFPTEEYITRYFDGVEDKCKAFYALFIPSYLRNAGAFTQSGLGNYSDSSITTVADGGSVKIMNDAGGITVKNLTNNEKNLISVWVMEPGSSGSLPTDKNDFKTGGRGHRGRRVRGGGDGKKYREALANVIQDKYKTYLLNGRQGINPYLVCMCKLIDLKKDKPCEVHEYLWDYNPIICFYLLLEPYKINNTNPLLTNELVEDWYNNTVRNEGLPKNLSGYVEFVSSGTLPDVQTVKSSIDSIRMDILQNSTTPSAMIQKMKKSYSDLHETGALKPSHGANLPINNTTFMAPGKKLWQDTLRFNMHSFIRAFSEAQPSDAAVEFENFIVNIKAIWPGNNYDSELCIGNDPTHQYPRAAYMVTIMFINSSDFLYFVSPSKNLEGLAAQSDIQAPKQREVFHRDAHDMKRVTAENSSAIRSSTSTQNYNFY